MCFSNSSSVNAAIPRENVLIPASICSLALWFLLEVNRIIKLARRGDGIKPNKGRRAEPNEPSTVIINFYSIHLQGSVWAGQTHHRIQFLNLPFCSTIHVLSLDNSSPCLLSKWWVWGFFLIFLVMNPTKYRAINKLLQQPLLQIHFNRQIRVLFPNEYSKHRTVS